MSQNASIQSLVGQQKTYFQWFVSSVDYNTLLRLQYICEAFFDAGMFTQIIFTNNPEHLFRIQLDDSGCSMYPDSNPSFVNYYFKINNVVLKVPLKGQLPKFPLSMDASDPSNNDKFKKLQLDISTDQLQMFFSDKLQFFQSYTITDTDYYSFSYLFLKLYSTEQMPSPTMGLCLDCFKSYQLLKLESLKLNIKLDFTFFNLCNNVCGKVLSEKLKQLNLTVSFFSEFPSFPQFDSLEQLSIIKRLINPTEILYILWSCQKLTHFELQCTLLLNGVNFLTLLTRNYIRQLTEMAMKLQTKIVSFTLKTNSTIPIQSMCYFLFIMPVLKELYFTGNLGVTTVDSDTLLKFVPEQKKKRLLDFIQNSGLNHKQYQARHDMVSEIIFKPDHIYSLEQFDRQYQQQEADFVNVFNQSSSTSDNEQAYQHATSYKKSHTSYFGQRSAAQSITKNTYQESISDTTTSNESELNESDDEFDISIGFNGTDLTQELMFEQEKLEQKKSLAQQKLLKKESMASHYDSFKMNIVSQAKVQEVNRQALSNYNDQYNKLSDYVINDDSGVILQELNSKFINTTDWINELDPTVLNENGQQVEQHLSDVHDKLETQIVGDNFIDDSDEKEADQNMLAAQTMDLAMAKLMSNNQQSKRAALSSLFNNKKPQVEQKPIEIDISQIKLNRNNGSSRRGSRIIVMDNIFLETLQNDFGGVVQELAKPKLQRQKSCPHIDQVNKGRNTVRFHYNMVQNLNFRQELQNLPPFKQFSVELTKTFKTTEEARILLGIEEKELDYERQFFANSSIDMSSWAPRIYESMYTSAQTIQFSSILGADRQLLFNYYQKINDQKLQNEIGKAVTLKQEQQSYENQQSLASMQCLYGQQIQLSEKNQISVLPNAQLNRLYLLLFINPQIQKLLLPSIDFNFKEIEFMLEAFTELNEMSTVSIPSYQFIEHKKLESLEFTNQCLFNTSLVEKFPNLTTLSLCNVVFAGKTAQLNKCNLVKICDSRFLDQAMLYEFVAAIKPKHLILKNVSGSLSEEQLDQLGVEQMIYD